MLGIRYNNQQQMNHEHSCPVKMKQFCLVKREDSFKHENNFSV
jgi:hypothetical protein